MRTNVHFKVKWVNQSFFWNGFFGAHKHLHTHLFILSSISACTHTYFFPQHTVIILWGINCFEPSILHGLYESQWESDSWGIGIETVCSGNRSWITMDSMSPDASIALRMLFICKLTIKPRTTEPHCHWALQQNAAGQINSHWRSERLKWPEVVSY